ncbi:hypothetical protein B0H63DRAFT_542389 [Podospora didyma]|uniref:Uncharacterized protein n=1 Tax=Podospora didyma TaxID=330526 RepID=A0AAE0NUF6_9PEZI|nr:hypothetical protein B0H63DRAFT_542389 [Podospora didyma]
MDPTETLAGEDASNSSTWKHKPEPEPPVAGQKLEHYWSLPNGFSDTVQGETDGPAMIGSFYPVQIGKDGVAYSLLDPEEWAFVPGNYWEDCLWYYARNKTRRGLLKDRLKEIGGHRNPPSCFTKILKGNKPTVKKSDSYDSEESPVEFKGWGRFGEAVDFTFDDREHLYKLLVWGQVLFKACQEVEVLGGSEEGGRRSQLSDLCGSLLPSESNARYVKLNSKDVSYLNTSGGSAAAGVDDVFIPRDKIERWAQEGMEDWEEGGFWMRNAGGRPQFLRIESGYKRDGMVSQKSWRLRLNKAISSLEGAGGWNRAYNPILELFLVPKGDEVNIQDLQKMADDVQEKRPSCRQIGRAVHTSQLGTSPFNHYETWILRNQVWDVYTGWRGTRQGPATETRTEAAEAAAKLQWDNLKNLVENVEEHGDSAAASKRLDPRTKAGEGMLVSFISAEKILAARGKRSDVIGQSAVMGSSATEVAQMLAWSDPGVQVPAIPGSTAWPGTGVYAAEWLHRSAFSYGGLANQVDVKTSQIRENMVFGTSECNSLMTRYEKAFQDLLLLEKNRKGGNAKALLMTHTRVTHLNGTLRGIRGDPPPLPTRYPETEYDVPWVSYAMTYTFQLYEPTVGFPLPTKRFNTVFYPFERTFFTVLEQEIDSMLLKQLFTKVAKAPVGGGDVVASDLVGDVVEIKTRRSRRGKLPGGKTKKKIVQKDEEDEEDEDGSDEYVHKKPQFKSFDNETQSHGIQRMQDIPFPEIKLFSSAKFDVPSLEMEQTPGQQKLGKQVSIAAFESLETPEAEKVEVFNPLEMYRQVWTEVNSLGPTEADGILLEDARPVFDVEPEILKSVNSTLSSFQRQPVGKTRPTGFEQPVISSSARMPDMIPNPTHQDQVPEQPDEFVLKGKYMLFGKIEVEIRSLQSPDTKGIHQRVSLPHELSLDTFISSLADSPINAIKLSNTTLEYRSHGTETAAAGLTISATVRFSRSLNEVNRVLRDVFRQTDPRLELSGVLSTQDDWLGHVPQPSGFQLRGKLPSLGIELFDEGLKLTSLGVDIIATRISSKGGYDCTFGFFGDGVVCGVTVDWYILKNDKQYHFTAVAKSDKWKGIRDIPDLDLEDIMFQASWTGTNLKSVMLRAQANVSLRESSLSVYGSYMNGGLEIGCALRNCSLKTLQQLYKDLFHDDDLKIDSDHDVLFNNIELVLSTSDGITLSGDVTIDGHISAAACIKIGKTGVKITGSVADLYIEELKDVAVIDSAALDLDITKDSFSVQLSAGVTVLKEHKFDVSIYLAKSSRKELQYTLYGAYLGDFKLRNIVKEVEGNELLDISLQQVAICASNMDAPRIGVKSSALTYEVKPGVQIYAKISQLAAASNVVGIQEPRELTLSAFFNPKTGNFGVEIELPTKNMISLGCVQMGPSSMGVMVASGNASLHLTATLEVTVPKRVTPLELELDLTATTLDAKGSAELKAAEEAWENPFGLCPALKIRNIKAGLGIIYEQFLATGTPSSITIGGDFSLYDFSGSMDLHLGAKPDEQLIRLELTNLNVARLAQLLGKLMGEDIILPNGQQGTFYIRHLLVYFSTGVTLKKKEYPAGIELDIDATIFGKVAKLNAKVSRSEIKIKGSVDSFELGDLKVTSADGKGGNPYIDVELSKSVQKIHCSGRVAIKENFVVVDVHIDSGTKEFFFYFDLVIVDALQVKIKAELIGGMPDVIGEVKGGITSVLADRNLLTGGQVEEEEEEEEEKEKEQAPSSPFSGGTQKEPAATSEKHGPLADKRFKIDAVVQQDILNYIVKLANEHLEKEFDPNRKQALHNEYLKKAELFGVAKKAFDAKRDQIDSDFQKKTAAMLSTIQPLVEAHEKAQKELDECIVQIEIKDRELVSKMEQEKMRVEAEEAAKTVMLEAASIAARQALEECKRGVLIMEGLHEVVERAKSARDAAEDDMALAETACDASERKEPAATDLAHAPWRWAHRELVEQRDAKSQAFQQKLLEHTIALAAFDEKADTSAKAFLKVASSTSSAADATFLAHQSSTKATLKKAQTTYDDHLKSARNTWKLDQKQKQARLDRAFAREKLVSAELAEQLQQEQITTQFDVETIPEYKNLVAAQMAMRKADVASRSFNSLDEAVAQFGSIFRDPLQLALKEMGSTQQKLVNIKLMKFTGEWGGSTGKITAWLEGTLGLQDIKFKLNYDMTDLVGFLQQLWLRIGWLMSQVWETISQLLKEGKEVLEKAKRDLDQGLTQGLAELGVPREEFDKALDQVAEDAKRAAKEAGSMFVQGTKAWLDAQVKPVVEGVKVIKEVVKDAGKAVDRAEADFDREMERLLRDNTPLIVEVDDLIGEVDRWGKNKERAGLDRLQQEAEDLERTKRLAVDRLIDEAEEADRKGKMVKQAAAERIKREAEDLERTKRLVAEKVKRELEEADRARKLVVEEAERSAAARLARETAARVERELREAQAKARRVQDELDAFRRQQEERARWALQQATRPVEDFGRNMVRGISRLW